jgi:UDP-N-acetylmuramoylalanine--D-glutamate ligase
MSRDRVAIIGLAREGVALARYFATQGDDVVVTDTAPADARQEAVDELAGLGIDFQLGCDGTNAVATADRVFVSPGVPESSVAYTAACKRGTAIESMTTLFFELCTAPIVGITGSSGKTTTTGLIGAILKTEGRDVLVGGNIGDPMIDLLPRIRDESIVVLELSSFQLGLLHRSPHIAVVTNISPNHLDRHGSMDAYVAAKRHIVEHQTGADVAVLNACDHEVQQFAGHTPGTIRWFGNPERRGAHVSNDTVVLGNEREPRCVIALSQIPLLGAHNVENVLAAVAAADVIGVPPEAMAEAIRTFKPAPHRLQMVGERDGVRFVDDSIATSTARALVAMRAVDAPLVLIAGGRDKHLPWDEFAREAAARLKAVVLIGEAAGMIERELRSALGRNSQLQPDMIRRCPTLEEAVAEARSLAQRGDVVLLAPGCTSYDMYTDFHERGLAFARAVEDLNAA